MKPHLLTLASSGDPAKIGICQTSGMIEIVTFGCLMCRSCHLDRVSNVELGVEYRTFFVVVFLYVAVKCILGHLQGLDKVG